MAPEYGSVSFNSTGNKTILLNTGTFTPSLVVFWCGGRFGTNETEIRYSTGVADFANGNDNADAIFNNTIDGTRSSTTRCVLHYRDNAGTPTIINEASQVSASPGDFTINVNATDVNTQWKFIAYP